MLNLEHLNITGDPVIVNTLGDVMLPTSLVFQGQDLSVLSKGNIIAAGSTFNIDLSSPDATGNGGNLTMVAGYDFTPSTTGQVTSSDPAQTFTLGSPSSTGGNIYLGGAGWIKTAATGGNAGNVTMIAHRGTGTTGNVFEGVVIASAAVDASSQTGNGGNVLVIASSDNVAGTVSMRGVSRASGGDSGVSQIPYPYLSFAISFFPYQSGHSYLSGIDSSSLAGKSGNVNVFASNPVIENGPITFTNGTQGGTGSFAPTRDAQGQVIVPSTIYNISKTVSLRPGICKLR